jgi:hypothetical protein
METMESWDIALLVVVGYLAIVALVRLMARHRDQVVERFRQDIEREKQQRKSSSENKAAPTTHRRAG